MISIGIETNFFTYTPNFDTLKHLLSVDTKFIKLLFPRKANVLACARGIL